MPAASLGCLSPGREFLEQPCEASPVCVYMRAEVGDRLCPHRSHARVGRPHVPVWKIHSPKPAFRAAEGRLSPEGAMCLMEKAGLCFCWDRPRPPGCSHPPQRPVCFLSISQISGHKSGFVLTNICFALCFDLFRNPGQRRGAGLPDPACRDGDPPGAWSTGSQGLFVPTLA